MDLKDQGSTIGPVCGVENCRSRRYEEGEDGYLYCQNGHRKGEMLAGEDEADFEEAGKTRTRKKKDQEGKVKKSQHFKGPKAFRLYLEGLQLILRHQLWFLTHERRLPSELETVVQDLWALRILNFEEKITSARRNFDSSQAEPASDSESDAEAKPVGLERRKKKLEDTPNLVDCLVLCYLGIITLRLPITPGDFYTWTTDGNLAFRRATRHLPIAMRDRLPGQYHNILDPDSLLNPEIFFEKITNIEVAFEKEFGILWPPLNVPLLLFRYLKELALPLEIYSATISLGDLLGFDFALHTDDKIKLGVRHIPEAQLAACLVICVKLFFPFDGERRHPKSRSEPAAKTLEWGSWCTIISNAKLTRREDMTKYTMEELANMQEKDVFTMNEDQMDQYLDFYLANFIDEAHTEPDPASDDFQNTMYAMFPVTSGAERTQPKLPDGAENEKLMETVKAVQGRMRPNPVVVDGEDGRAVRRPGQSYVAYKKESNLPEHAEVFFKEVARVTGLSVDMLRMAVFSTEKLIAKWTNEQKKREKEAST